MPTLTSLLSRDAVVSLDTIEQALQRQVLEGGELDTALLELARVPENVLASYRAASFGLPAAARSELEAIDPAILARVPREIACELRIVPIAVEGETLVIARAWPLREAELSQLATRLNGPIAIVIATEVRIHAVLSAEHGLELGGRMRLLAERLAHENPGELCAVNDAFPSNLPPPHTARPSEVVNRTLTPAIPVRVQADPPAKQDSSRPAPAPVRVLTMVTLGSANGRESRKQHDSEDALETRPSRPSRMPPPARASMRAMRRASKMPRGPMTQRQAVELLGKAHDRDAVLEAFFAFARQYFDCSVLFAVRDERLLGLEAWGLPQQTELQMVEVDIARSNNVQGVIRSRGARVVHLGQSPDDSSLVSAIRRANAQPCALLPIVVRQRVVSLLYGDRSGEALALTELADLLATLPAVSTAFERIIQERKLEAMRAQGGEKGAAKSPSEAPPQGTFSVPPPPQMPVATAARNQPRATKPPQPPARSPKPATREGSDDPVDRPTIQLPSDEIERGARLRAMQPMPVTIPQTISRTKREQDITRPARPSKLSVPRPPVEANAPAPQPAPPPEVDEPVDRPPPRTLSHPAPGVGSYAMRDAKREVIDTQERTPPKERAQASKEPASALLSPRPSGRVDPRREGGNKLAPEVVSMSAAVRDSLRTRASAENAPPTGDQAAEAERLVSQLSTLGPDEEALLVSSLVRLGSVALSALERRFPGNLWFDRHKLRTHVPAGRDVSAIARALLAFEAAALPAIARLLSASKAEVRLCALLVTQDCIGPELLPALGERLYDVDGPVRLLALETLPRFRHVPGFVELRRTLQRITGQESEPLQRRLSSLEALSLLRDESSVELLADLSGHANRQLSVPAHRTLIAITGQDFGTAPRKWKAWMDKNKRRHRAEWLIEGLMHSEERVRATAAAELQKLTQVYYGFVASAGKRDRERAQTRYREWWETEGRELFR